MRTIFVLLSFHARLQCLTVFCLVISGMARPLPVIVRVPGETGSQDSSAPYWTLPTVTTIGVEEEVCGHVTCDRKTEFCDKTLVHRCLPCDRDCSPQAIRGDQVFQVVCLKKCPVYMQSMSSTKQMYVTDAAADVLSSTTVAPPGTLCLELGLSSSRCPSSLAVTATLVGVSGAVLLFMVFFVWFGATCCTWRTGCKPGGESAQRGSDVEPIGSPNLI